MPTTTDVLAELRALANPDNVAGMARFGMSSEGRLGISIPELRRIAKKTGRDHHLALELWKTGIAEARILASMLDEPARVTERQMDQWVKDFDSWDVCDQVCMNLFEKTAWATKKVGEWSQRDEEFVKRAAFSLIACLAWHDKTAPDEAFVAFFPILKRGATDERNFVKKAVNWALRTIGKRNARLNAQALVLAREIQKLDSKSARWVAADAIRELESEPVRERFGRSGSRG